MAVRTPTADGRRDRSVIKGRGCPSDEACMASIALRRSHQMSSRLRLCVLRQIGAVMTGRALPEGADGVVHC
jgi:hypothetical protein